MRVVGEPGSGRGHWTPRSRPPDPSACTRTSSRRRAEAGARSGRRRRTRSSRSTLRVGRRGRAPRDVCGTSPRGRRARWFRRRAYSGAHAPAWCPGASSEHGLRAPSGSGGFRTRRERRPRCVGLPLVQQPAEPARRPQRRGRGGARRREERGVAQRVPVRRAGGAGACGSPPRSVPARPTADPGRRAEHGESGQGTSVIRCTAPIVRLAPAEDLRA